MPFKVQVGPPQIAIHQAMTVLVTEPDGQVRWPTDKGLYFFDTRLISAWSVYANGEPWDLLNGGAVSYDAARIFLTNRGFLTEDGPVPVHSLAFVLSRAIDGGLHEDLDLTNHGQRPVRFNLEIAIRSDFADIFDVKAGRSVRRGRITTEWSETHQRLRTLYRNRDFMRAVSVSVGQATSRAAYANGRLSFEVALAPAATWHACLLYELVDGERHFHRSARLPSARPSFGSRGGAAHLAADGAENPHQQRGILPLLPSGDRRHGGAAPADRRAPTTWCSFPPPACPGSWRRSAATA